MACIHEHYINCKAFVILQSGNDFDVLALPVTINSVDAAGYPHRLLCIDYFNLAQLKEAIDKFEQELCNLSMGTKV